MRYRFLELVFSQVDLSIIQLPSRDTVINLTFPHNTGINLSLPKHSVIRNMPDVQ